MSNSNNLTYFKSEYARVFPCAYRGFKPTESTDALKANPVVWNADASLTTEYNLTHMFSHLLGQQSFIVSSPEKPADENAKKADFKCVINGYYFEIDGDAFCRAYDAYYGENSWINSVRGEREGCLCIRVLPKFEKGATGETPVPVTADFNLTSLITLELTQTSEGYLLDNESGEFTGLAYYPNLSTISSLSAMLTDGSVLYHLPLNDESLYAETVYQEIKEKIIEGVKAVNWSKHLEVAPLSVGSDLAIDLNSYAGTSNLHTFYVGDLKTLCNNESSSGLKDLFHFPPALGSALSETTTPDLFLALEVFDPGIGSTSSPKTSPIIQILHTFGYSKAKIAAGYTALTTNRINTYGSTIETEGGSRYYTKEFDLDCCTFIRYGHRSSSTSGAVITWKSWEGLSEEELKLFACLRAVEAEQRLADDLILGNTIPRFAERLKANIHKGHGQTIPANLKPGWYCYLQPKISALALLGGDGLASTVSWEQKQLLSQASAYTYNAFLEVIGEDTTSTSPRLQRIYIINSSNNVIATCTRAVTQSSSFSTKWTFDITSANIQDQLVARADKQKAYQIADYVGLKGLIKNLYENSARSNVSRDSLQVELQFTNVLEIPVPSYSSATDSAGEAFPIDFYIASGTIGHLTTTWKKYTSTGWVFQLSLELQKFGFEDTDAAPAYDKTRNARYSLNGISFSQTLAADLVVLEGQTLTSALDSLRWVVHYPANVQNPIPLNSYSDLIELFTQILLKMPFGLYGATAVSTENNLSVPVVITDSFMINEEGKDSTDYEIPRGSIGYLAVQADQMIPENRDEYGSLSDLRYPFIGTLNLLTLGGRSILAHYYYGRICNGGREDAWEISEGHVAEADHASYADVAGEVAGNAVYGIVKRAESAARADVASRADEVYGTRVIGVVSQAENAKTARNLNLKAAYADYAEDTDTGIGDSLLGSTVTARVKDPGLYLVEVVVKDVLGLNAYRDSTFFFIPECSDQQAPRTKQVLCSGVVTLDTTYSYIPSTRDDYWHLNTVTFEALAPHSFSGSVAIDLAIKVWRIADANGKANGPFQNN